MIQATPQLQTAMVFAAILLLSAISVVMFILVTAAERFLIPWADDGKSL
jgi:putative hydroxymethylpyrimidine transport system permease protein